jgi:hypothetical protein
MPTQKFIYNRIQQGGERNFEITKLPRTASHMTAMKWENEVDYYDSHRRCNRSQTAGVEKIYKYGD